MSDDIQRVAFIGLGKMGAGIARNIQQAGFALTLYNRTAAKMQPFVDAGATAADSPRAAAAGADAVITSLMDDQSMIDAVSGDAGILAGLRPDAIHIGTTTVSPACAKRVADLHAAHGSHYLAGPVLGRPDVAEAGELRTFLAGDPETIARCESLVESYSSMVLTVGTEPHVANSVKLCVNYMMAAVIELMGQVYTFGEKSGIESQLMGMLMATMFPQPQIQEYAERIRAREFDEAGFTLVGGLKDVELFLKASGDVRTTLPYANIMRDKLLTAISHGMGARDWSAVYEVSRMQAGLTCVLRPQGPERNTV